MKKSIIIRMKLALYCASFLLMSVTKVFAQLPITDLSTKQEFQAVIQQPYIWNQSEKQQYLNIIQQPRFSLCTGGGVVVNSLFSGNSLPCATPFDIDNPDHLRALKDRLEVLETYKILRSIDVVGMGPNPVLDPCLLSLPNNTYSKFNRVTINYNLMTPMNIVRGLVI